jgi:very-short-patch-repair endonuclease
VVEVARIEAFMRSGSVPPGRVLARIAAGQHGVVSRAQVLALGVGSSYVTRLLAGGRLHLLHRGVYAVGHRGITERGRWTAAVLAAGEGAVLSHISAGLLWGIIDLDTVLIHVLVPGRGTLRRPGIVIHRTRDLPTMHRIERYGIPVTNVDRTLLDLAAMLPPDRLGYAVEAAGRFGRLELPALVALCDASPGRRGAGTLRRIALGVPSALRRTKSPPETAFLRLCAGHELPEPLVNTILCGYEVDFLWPGPRLVVEVDTYTYHRSWAQRQRDLERDADLKTRGYDVLRFSRERIERDGPTVAAQVATVLGLRATAGSS